MLLLFTTELPAMDPKNATQLLRTFAQFNASLRKRPAGGYMLTVPSGRAPLRTQRLLLDFCQQYGPHYRWKLLGVDDEGCPTIPLCEERAP